MHRSAFCALPYPLTRQPGSMSGLPAAVLRGACLAGALLAVGLLHGAGMEKWQVATPEELAGMAPTLEPGVAAEAILWKIEVDDSEFPEVRTINEYVRYKVFDPQRADRLMRLSEQSLSYDGTMLRAAEMGARLTLPDGTAQEFGAESIKERTVLRKGDSESLAQRLFGAEGVELKEKFLAVGNVQPGSILEVRTSVKEHYPRLASFRPLQMDAVSVLRLEYRLHPASEEHYNRSVSLLNTTQLELKTDKKSGVVTVLGGRKVVQRLRDHI